MKNELSRRVFFERLGACAVGAAALSQATGRPAAAEDTASRGAPTAVAWTPPPSLINPNILFILVDQFRWPAWLTSSQMTTLDKIYLPNIFGRLRDNSYVFQQYYTAATMCTPSRATLLTGLYAPQTAVYETGQGTPTLNPAFPTWGEGIAALNSTYQNNVWWFGKWHLSDEQQSGASPLLPYGFNTRNYPGALGPSPNGWPNEGLNGGVNQAPGPDQGITYASDEMIAGDFIAWLNGNPAASWCATVSLINPHDIWAAPGWFANTLPPAGVPSLPVYFPTDFPNGVPPNPPPAGYSASPAALYTALPSSWNFENLGNPHGANYVSTKPSLQYTFLQNNNQQFGAVKNWTQFLNWYYWLENFVDQQVGAVLNALTNSPYAGNTIVVFASDHGEYAGSHGEHGKGGAVYDESLHVPLYVQFPGQVGSINMSQMCSSVDFFGLMCDLATSGSGAWRTTYPDLANRQSIWNFLYANSSETRTVTVGPGNAAIPYVLHTVDETNSNEYCPLPGAPPPDNRHIVCLRTKFNAASPSPGGKLAEYSHWAPNNTCWDGVTPQEFEFYDYNPKTTNNQKEMGNDYFSSNPTTQSTMASYKAALGNWGAPPDGFNGSGLTASELDPPLIGKGTDGNPLTQAQAAAQQAFFQYTNPCNA